MQFTRRADNGTVAEFTRPDGVRLRLRSYDRTGLIPHDAAHLVVERAFGLTHGVWGCLSAGVLFGSAEIIEGRTRHDHRARSAALLKEHGAELRLAERVVGAVLAAPNGQTRSVSRDIAATWSLSPVTPPTDPDQAGRAALTELTELRRRWDGLRTGDTFDAEWPVPRPGRRRAPGRPIR